MEKLVIGQMTWPELEQELEHIKVALVPVGSCEQHGPNTTFVTDAARASSFAEKLAERCGKKVVVFPPVTYGLSLHHMDFPGTVTLRVETMMNLLEDIGVSIAKHGIKNSVPERPRGQLPGTGGSGDQPEAAARCGGILVCGGI